MESEKHPDYPDGFPPAADESLFGRHDGDAVIVDVAKHEHGYELRFHHPAHIVTVTGDRPDTVVRYLAQAGSPEHVKQLEELEGEATEEPAERP